MAELKKEVLEIRDRYPQLSLDSAFVAWFLRAFFAKDEAAAIESLKGGARDKGVDATYLDHDARMVFLVQGKYHQGSRPAPAQRSDVIALADLGRMLLSENKTGFESLVGDADILVADALEKARHRIHKQGYRLNLIFATTGKVSRTHQEEAEQHVEDFANAGFQVFARSDLLRLMRDYIEGVSPPPPAIALPIHGEQLFNRFDETTGISSWVFTMLGRELGKLYNTVGDRIFARNIRGFLGSTRVNRGMEATLKKEAEHFWYFNNGVTVVCDDARQITERGRRHLRLKSAQIINGQQTTRVLARHADNSATVLVRVIVVPRDSEDARGQYGHLVGQIVSATNFQNAISRSDLKANDIEQVRLEREFRKLGYSYVRKRQTKSEARRLTGNRFRYFVKKEELAKAAAACFLDPYLVRLGKDRLFEDGIYSEVFDSRRPAADYITFFWLNRIVPYFGRGDIRRGYAKWVVLNFVWSRLGGLLDQREMRDKFRYMAEREWKFRKEFRPLYRAADSVFSVAMKFYRDNRKSEDGILDESTFFKRTGLHKRFQRYWKSSRNGKRLMVERQFTAFARNLRQTTMD